MKPSSPQSTPRHYAVFISYRHTDNRETGRKWASWLHERLETFQVPAEYEGKLNLRGKPVPRSLYPVFRDEEELPADADLTNNIKLALERSDLLVVLCSPRAVQSRYVAEEIRYFKELGHSDRVLALMIDGEPNASDAPSKSALECLPEPLRFGMPRGDGSVDWSVRTEPIAADVRPDGRSEQGWTSAAQFGHELKKQQPTLSKQAVREAVSDYEKRLNDAVLKIVAGGLAVPFGELTQRDQVRALAAAKKRERVMMALAAVFGLLAIAAAAAGVVAWQMRGKAERSLVKETAALQQSQQSRSDADYRLGNAAIDDGKLPEALAFYASSLRNDPTNRQARAAALAALYSEQGLKWTLPDKIKALPPQASLVSIAHDGKWLVFDDGKAVNLWSGKDGATLSQWPHSQPLQSLSLTSGEAQLITWAEKDGHHSLVRPEANAVPLTIALPAETKSVTLAADQLHLVAVLPSPAADKPLDMNRVFGGKQVLGKPDPILFSQFGSTATPVKAVLEGEIKSHKLSPKGSHWAAVVHRGGGAPDKLELRETRTGKILQSITIGPEDLSKTDYAWLDDAVLLVLEDQSDLSVLTGTQRLEVELPSLLRKVVLGSQAGWVALLDDSIILGKVSALGAFTQVMEDNKYDWQDAIFSEDGQALYAVSKHYLAGWQIGQDAASSKQETSQDSSGAAKLSAPAAWGRAVELSDKNERRWVCHKVTELKAESITGEGDSRALPDQMVYLDGNEVSVSGQVLAHDGPLQGIGGVQSDWLTAANGKVCWWSLTTLSQYAYEDAYRGAEDANLEPGLLPAAVAEQAAASYGQEFANMAKRAPDHRSPSRLFLYTRGVSRCSMVYTDPPDGWTEVTVFDESGRLRLAEQLIPGEGEARLSDDGLHFFTHTTQRSLQAWDLLTGKEAPAMVTVPAGDEVLDLVGDAAWAVTRDRAGQSWLRPLSGQSVALPLGDGAEDGRGRARGRRLLSFLELKRGARISGWDLDQKPSQPDFTLECSDAAAYDFSPDGFRVAVVGDQRLRVWDFAKGAFVVDVTMPEGAAGKTINRLALYSGWAYRDLTNKERRDKWRPDYVSPDFIGHGRFVEMNGWVYDIEHQQWLRSTPSHSAVMLTALKSGDVATGLAEFLEAASGLSYRGATLQSKGISTCGDMVKQLSAFQPREAVLLDDLLRHWLKVERQGSVVQAWNRVTSFCEKEGLASPARYAYGSPGPSEVIASAAEREALMAGSPMGLLTAVAEAEALEDLPKAKNLTEQLLQVCAEREHQGRDLLPWDRLLQARSLARLGRLEAAAKAYAQVNPALASLPTTNLATLYRRTGIELAWLRGDREAAFKGLLEHPDLALEKQSPICLSVANDGSLSLRSWLGEARRVAPPLPPEIKELTNPMIWESIAAALDKPTPEGLLAVVKTLRNLLRYRPPNPTAIEPMRNDEPMKRRRYLDLAKAYELLKQPDERTAVLAEYEALLRTVMDTAEKNGVVDDDLWAEVAHFQEAKGDRAECIGAWRKAVDYKDSVASRAVEAAIRLGDRAAADDFFQAYMAREEDDQQRVACYAWFLDADNPSQAVSLWQRLEAAWQSPHRRGVFGPEGRSHYIGEAYPRTAELESQLISSHEETDSNRWVWLVGLAHDALRRGEQAHARQLMAEVLAVWPFIASDEFDPSSSYSGVLGSGDVVKAALARLRSLLPIDELTAARARGFICGNKDDHKPDLGLAMVTALPVSPGKQLAQAELLTFAQRWKEAAAAWLAITEPAKMLSPQRENMLLCARELCLAGDLALAKSLRDHALAAPTHSHADICLQAWLAQELGEDDQAQQLFRQVVSGRKLGLGEGEESESHLDLKELMPDQFLPGLMLASWSVLNRKDTARLVLECFGDEVETGDFTSSDFARRNFGFGPRSKQLGQELLATVKALPVADLVAVAGEAKAAEFLIFLGRKDDAKAWQAEHPEVNLTAAVNSLLERARRGDALKAAQMLRQATPSTNFWIQRDRQLALARAEQATGEADAACDRLFKLVSGDSYNSEDLSPLWLLARGLGRTEEFGKVLAPLIGNGKNDADALLYACRLAWEEKRYDDVLSAAKRRLDLPAESYDKEDEAQRWQALRYRLAATWQGHGAKAAHEALAVALADGGGRLSKTLNEDTEPDRLKEPLTALQKSWATLATAEIRELANRTTYAGSKMQDRLATILSDLGRFEDSVVELDNAFRTASPAELPRLLGNKAACLRLSQSPQLDAALKAARDAKAHDLESVAASGQLLHCLLASKLNDEAAEEALHYIRIGKGEGLTDFAVKKLAELRGEEGVRRLMTDTDSYGTASPQRLLHTAIGLQNRGDHANALLHLDEAAKDPEWKLDAEKTTVSSLWLLGRKDEALARYRAVLEEDDTAVGDAKSEDIAVRTRVELFQALKTKAQDEFEAWLATATTDTVQTTLAFLLHTLELKALARAVEAKLTHKPPYADNVLFQWLSAGKIAKAQDLARTLLRHPEATATHCAHAAYALAITGHADEGVAALDALVKDFGPVADVLTQRAWVLWNLGKTQEALADVEKAMRLQAIGSESDVDHLGHAGILWTLGRKAEAIAAFRLAAKADSSLLEPKAFVNDPLEASYWPEIEQRNLEEVRKATLAKHPELTSPPEDPSN